MRRCALGVILAAAWLGGCSTSPEAIRTRAISEYQVGHVRQAKGLFEQVLSTRPSDATSLYYMGRIACAEGAWEEAIYYLQCCLDADPSYQDARLLLARAQKEAGTAGKRLRFIPHWPADRAP